MNTHFEIFRVQNWHIKTKNTLIFKKLVEKNLPVFMEIVINVQLQPPSKANFHEFPMGEFVFNGRFYSEILRINSKISRNMVVRVEIILPISMKIVKKWCFFLP